MNEISVLGPGSKRCPATENMQNSAVKELDLEISIERITDFADMAIFGVASTPAIVIDSKVGSPRDDGRNRWLQA